MNHIISKVDHYLNTSVSVLQEKSLKNCEELEKRNEWSTEKSCDMP